MMYTAFVISGKRSKNSHSDGATREKVLFMEFAVISLIRGLWITPSLPNQTALNSFRRLGQRAVKRTDSLIIATLDDVTVSTQNGFEMPICL